MRDRWRLFAGFDTSNIGSLSKDYSCRLIIIIEAMGIMSERGKHLQADPFP